MNFDNNKLAKIITEYSVGVDNEDKVLVDGDPISTSQIHINLHKEILKRGGIPIHKLTLEDCDYLNLMYGDENQYRLIAEEDKKWVENSDIFIMLQSANNTKRADGIEQNKIRQYNNIKKIVKETAHKNYFDGKLKLFYLEYPTVGMAQENKMSILEYEEHFKKACFLEYEDPIKEWKKLSEKHEKYINFLKTKEKFRIEGDKTDLTFSINNNWISDEGRRYLPDGEIFTDSPVKESLNGYITFSYPGIYNRKYIENIRLEFKNGELVEATSTTEQELLKKLLIDPKKVYVSAFGIGTNYNIDRFIGHMAFDEKMGGTIHLALRGSNMFHMWVLLKKMNPSDCIFADDEIFYKDSKIIIE